MADSMVVVVVVVAACGSSNEGYNGNMVMEGGSNSP